MMAGEIRPRADADQLHRAAAQLATNPERRFRHDWTRDGLPDLFFGVLLLVVTGSSAALSFSSARLPWTILLFPVLVIGGSVAVTRGFFVMKARLSDPRVGFVRPRLPLMLRSPWFLRGYVMACAVGGGLIPFIGPPIRDLLYRGIPGFESWWPLLWLVPGLICLLGRPRWFGTTGHLWVAILTVLATVAGLQLGLSVRETVRWIGWPSIGLGHVVVGALALRSFLRTHRRPASG